MRIIGIEHQTDRCHFVRECCRASTNNTLQDHLVEEIACFVLAGQQPEFADKVKAFLGHAAREA